MNFLVLTCLNGEAIRINFNYIESYGVITKDNYNFNDYCPEWEGYTFLCPVGISNADDIYVVKEAPQEIDRMLNPRWV